MSSINYNPDLNGNPKKFAENHQASLEVGVERYLIKGLGELKSKYDFSILAKRSKKQILKIKISELKSFREEMAVSNSDTDITPLMEAKLIELDERYGWVDGTVDGMDNILKAEIPRLEKWLTKYSEMNPVQARNLLRENGWILKLLYKNYGKTET